jgi:uncharacterized protein YicC (UPF0701 family)
MGIITSKKIKREGEMKSIKERIMGMVSNLPNNVDLEEVMYRMMIMEGIEKGKAEVRQGKVKTHKEVEKLSKTWK